MQVDSLKKEAAFNLHKQDSLKKNVFCRARWFVNTYRSMNIASSIKNVGTLTREDKTKLAYEISIVHHYIDLLPNYDINQLQE